MWEKDKLLIRKVRECFAEIDSQLEAGEQVDFGEICQKETDALLKYTYAKIDVYKNSHPTTLPEKKAKLFNPKIPFYQNF